MQILLRKFTRPLRRSLFRRCHERGMVNPPIRSSTLSPDQTPDRPSPRVTLLAKIAERTDRSQARAMLARRIFQNR